MRCVTHTSPWHRNALAVTVNTPSGRSLSPIERLANAR
jgi:hypothetical protein